MSAQHQLLVLPSASIVVLGLQKEMRQHEATLENEHLLGDPRPKTIALAGWEVVFFYPRSKDRPVLWRLFWRMLCNGGGAAEGNPFIDWHSDWNCR